MSASAIPNYNVPLPQIQTPIQSIGQLMQLRSGMADLALKQQQAKQAQANTADIEAQAQQRNRDLSDQNTIQDILKDPVLGPKIAGGDTTPLLGKVQESTRQKLDTSLADIHAKKATTAKTDLENSNAALGRLTQSLSGLQTTFGDDVGKINEALPALIASLDAQGVFKDAGIDSSQLPKAISDPSDLRKMEAHLGIAQAINDKALEIKGEQGKQAKEVADTQKTVADTAKIQAELPGTVAESQTKQSEAVIKKAQADAMKALASGDPADIDKTVDAIVPASDPMNASGKTLLHTLVQHGASIETINGAIKDMYDQRGRVQVAKESAQNKLSIDMGSVLGAHGEPSALAKQVANYQVPFTSAVARLPPVAREQLAQEIQELNPDFQASNFQTYQSTEKDATTGKIGTSANALNTMMGHLTILGQAADALKNGDIQILNKLANSLGAQVGQTPKTTYETIVHRVGPEVTKAYLASGGSVGERGTNEADFSSSLSPDQIKSNIGISAALADSKIKALQDQYQRGTYGRGKQKLISDEAEAARKSLASGGSSATHKAGETQVIKGVTYQRDDQGNWHPK